MIEAVLFDMDGILIDSEREYDKAMREAITRYGHMITDEFFDQSKRNSCRSI